MNRFSSISLKTKPGFISMSLVKSACWRCSGRFGIDRQIILKPRQQSLRNDAATCAPTVLNDRSLSRLNLGMGRVDYLLRLKSSIICCDGHIARDLRHECFKSQEVKQQLRQISIAAEIAES